MAAAHRSCFFYGTLIDPDVRAAVLGRLGDRAPAIPDTLAGWQAVGVRGRVYPVIVPASSESVTGIRVTFAAAAARRAMDRLVAFEGAEYSLRTVRLVSGEDAFVFTGSAVCRPDGRPWSFADWRRRHKRGFLAGMRPGRPV